jgi:hypothetical protein
MNPAHIRILLALERELEAHRRERERVLASLIALPGARKPNHRRCA